MHDSQFQHENRVSVLCLIVCVVWCCVCVCVLDVLCVLDVACARRVACVCSVCSVQKNRNRGPKEQKFA